MIKELEKEDTIVIKEIEERFPNLSDIKKSMDDNPFNHFLLYEEKKEIMGVINYYLIYDRIEIVDFNVLDAYQNRGIGTKLIKYLIDKYQGKIKNMTLEVRQDNSKAIHIYTKMGFKECAIRKGYYQGVDGILMEKVM